MYPFSRRGHLAKAASALLFLFLGLIYFSGSAAFAQSASISGIITDPSGAVISNAQVTLTSKAEGTSLQAKSNSSGFYSLPFVPPGGYTMTVESAGFKQLNRTDIAVNVAQTITVNARLQIGDTSQSVMVDGSGLNMNTTDATVSTVIDHQFTENMPLNGRSLQSLMTLAPGVTQAPSAGAGIGGELTVNGQRLESNYFTVDGVSATAGVQVGTGNLGSGAGYGGSVSSSTALGTTQSMISVDALEEFRASTSTYSAEYGRGPGGQFSFSSRSGSNQWHGSAFDYFRNDALDANNWFNGYTNSPPAPKQAERQNDFGGVIGGPIVIPGIYTGKDKSFIFFSYEGLRLLTPQGTTQYFVPSLSLREEAPTPELAALVNAFPKPNGEDFGDGMAVYKTGYSSPSRINSFSLRIDHSLNSKYKLFARYSHAPSNSSNPVPSQAQTNIYDIKNDTLTLGMTAAFNDRLANDLRFGAVNNDSTHNQIFTSFNGGVDPNVASLEGGNKGFIFGLTWSGGATFPIVHGIQNQIQLNVIDKLTATIGHHTLRFGVDYRRSGNNAHQIYSQQEGGWFYSRDSFLANKTDSMYISKFPNATRPVYTNLSLFAQDDWKATPRLSFSLGLRWDFNPAPKDSAGFNPYTVDQIDDLATATLAPKNADLWHTYYGGLAPRLGVAYQLRQQSGSELVLRGGFGLFYDTGSALGSQGYVGVGTNRQADLTGSAFPATKAQFDSVSNPAATIPITDPVFAYDPNLKLPVTYQWNVAIEQALGKKQKINAAYVGSAGRRLTSQTHYIPNSSGNVNFASGTSLYITKNGAASNYNALQAQYQSVLTHGLQALVSYTWSHAIDEVSSNGTVYTLERGSSDYDARHNLQVALTYDLPGKFHNAASSIALSHWSVDSRFVTVTALPVDVVGGFDYNTDGTDTNYHPNRVQGQPLYVSTVDGIKVPGGKAINYAAFVAAYDVNGKLIEGDSGRNAARSFGTAQLDLAMHKGFHLKENATLTFRAEAFNVLNHPMFGGVYGYLTNGPSYFGIASSTLNSSLGGLNSMYQTGGPRSLQLALKLQF